jgi:para-nitrobenzyl esterase
MKDTTAKLAVGTVRGTVSEDGVRRFLGIPYALPPVGSLRWRPPVPMALPEGAWDATEYRARSFQRKVPASLTDQTPPGEMSEDMLYVNVFAPPEQKEPLPVLVWIHGGGFIMGSANDFDLGKLALDENLVILALNYRLGMFGFLDLSRFGPEYAGSASIGFQDQILALEWIRNNVAGFGGDPERITICGGSAGGGSVLAMMCAPTARGLFQRAIAISPSEISPQPIDIFTPVSAAMKVSEEALFAQFKAMSGKELFDWQNGAGIGGMAAVDGTILRAPIAKAIAQRINPVPLVAGSTLDEGPMLTAELGTNPETFRFFEGGLVPMINQDAPRDYVAWLESTEHATPAARLNRVWTDFFRSSVLHAVAGLTDIGVPAWSYRFAVPTDHPFGPTHGSDVRFAFNGFTKPDDGTHYAFYRNTDANRRIAAGWSATLAEFVRSGRPQSDYVPDWPAYTADRRATLVLEDRPKVVDGLDPPEALVAFGIAGKPGG